MTTSTIRATAAMQAAAEKQRTYRETMSRLADMKAALSLSPAQITAIDIAYFCVASCAGQATAQRTYWEALATLAANEKEPMQ